MRASLAGLSLAVVAMLPLLSGCGEQATSATPKPERPVQVQRVAFQRENAGRDFVGVVRARYETDLGFRVAGKITARIVNVGDRVHAGDVIARLDPEDLKLSVASAHAELAAATSNLAQTTSDEQRYNACGRAAMRRSLIMSARRRPRMRRTAALNARNGHWTWRATSWPTPSSRPTPTAPLPLPLPNLDRSLPLGRPLRGLRTAARWKHSSPCRRPGSKRRVSSQAAVKLWAGPQHRYAARLRELSPQADPLTRTYAARFTIENPDDAVALGMTATVTLSHAVNDSSAKLPLAAILNRGQAHRCTWSASRMRLSCGRSRLRPSQRMSRLSPRE